MMMTPTRRQLSQALAAVPLFGAAPRVKRRSVLIFDESEAVASIMSVVIENRFQCRPIAVTDAPLAQAVLHRRGDAFDVVIWGGSTRLSHAQAKHVIWCPPIESRHSDCDLQRPFSTKALEERITEITGWKSVLIQNRSSFLHVRM